MQVDERPIRLITQAIDERAQHLQPKDLGFIRAVDTPSLERRAVRKIEIGEEGTRESCRDRFELFGRQRINRFGQQAPDQIIVETD